MIKLPYILVFAVILLSGCAKNYIDLSKKEWECIETYEHYTDGYFTTQLVDKTLINVYHPSSTTTKCATYRLKEELLSKLAKKEKKEEEKK